MNTPDEKPLPLCAFDWFTATLPKFTFFDSNRNKIWPEQLPGCKAYPLEVRRNGEVLGLLDSPPDNVFVPAERSGDEAGILWLRSPELYPVYVRESRGTCCGFELPTFQIARHLHMVAVAILKTEKWASRPLDVVQYRFWWVKDHDAFHGYQPRKDAYVHTDGAPTEAVLTASVAPNIESTRGYDRAFPRDTLRVCRSSQNHKNRPVGDDNA